MALTLQNVADDVSYELRLMLDGTSGSGANFNLLARWIDQVHKDLLHTGIYRHALRQQTTITVAAGTRSYALTPTDVRRIEAVYSRPQETFLAPISEAFAPSSLADPADIGGGARPDNPVAAHRVSGLAPRYYWLDTTVTAGVNSHTLYIFPPALTSKFAGTYDVLYIQQAATVSAAADTLAAGTDSRDAMVAGVLARAYRYLGWLDLSNYWKAQYDEMKTGETAL